MHTINKDDLLFTLFDAQPDFVVWMKPLFSVDIDKENKITDFEICYYNKSFAVLTGVSKQEAIGKRLVRDSVLGTEQEHIVFEQSLEVFLHAVSRDFTYFNTKLQKYFCVTRTKVKDGILNVARDITTYIIAEKRMHEQSAFLSGILDASINAVFVCDAIRDDNGKIYDLRIIKINKAFKNLIGKNAAEAEGITYLSLFPAAKNLGLFDLNCKVIETGEPLRKEVYYKGENLDSWFDISLVKLGENYLLVTFNDITEAKQSLQHIERQNALLDNILKNSPSGIAVVKLIRDLQGKAADGLVILANNAATKITNISPELMMRKLSEFDSEITSNPLFPVAISMVERGKPFLTQQFLKVYQKWLEIGVSRIDDEHLVLVFTDITSAKTAQLEIERSAAQMLSFINTTQSGLSHLTPVKNKAGELIDFRLGIANAAFAAYVGQKPEAIRGETVGNSYPLYKTNGLFERYKHTYNTGETVRFEFYYDGNGCAADAWFDIVCTKMEDGVLVTLTELTTVKKLQIDLEILVNELKKSNEGLQEFAYVASHDLQEPLRKIQVFAERLKHDVGDNLGEENKRVFERMIAATERMSQLIKDLLAYSQLTIKPSAFKSVDLKELIQQVLSDLETAITEKNGTVSVSKLPAIKGDELQLRQLFQNLISNSLKYSREGINPVVKISFKKLNKEINGLSVEFNRIEISDNGIGFEQQYADRIFKVFQRLHGRSEYPGTGIGLAIVQKVVENHNGYIEAKGEPGEGATFEIFLPV